MGARPVLAVSADHGLEARLRGLRDGCIARWRATPADLPRFGTPVSWRRQWSNARATRRLVNDLATRIEAYPSDDAARRIWREAVRRRLHAFGESRFAWPDGYRRLFVGDAFFESAAAFATRARAFDPSLPLDELWQALRNVWIGNSLQALRALPVSLTQGLFAYSMLYPVTDNVLDDAEMSAVAKRTFNDRLGRRLAGERLTARDAAEARAFALLAQIEDDRPRFRWPDVWAGIAEIHRAQVDSLRQHGALVEDELLELSVAKGGASVLADLYLIAPGVTPCEERFAFAYGVFLQLLDDLQDVGTDLAAEHHTLFTHAARNGVIDDLTTRLARFIDVTCGAAPHDGTREREDCIDLIRRNCLALIVGVIAEHPGRFSRAFRRSVEHQWPLGLRELRRLRRHAARRYQTTAQRLREHHGVGSPLDLLLPEALS
jgi:hypothetical protein